MKKEVTGQELINLKRILEDMIAHSSQLILSNNSILKKDKKNAMNIDDHYDKLVNLYKHLQIVKTGLNTINNKKTKAGKTLQELIYEKSDLEREKTLLNELLAQNVKSRKNGEQDVHHFVISKNDLDLKLIEVEKRIKEIKETMTNHNTTTKIKIVIDDDLKLI